MGLDCRLDYPLGLTDIKDKDGADATIDGAAQFKLTDAAMGEILIASGDPRPELPDGTAFYRPADAPGLAFKLECHVDPNLNPNVTDDVVIATVEDVLIKPAGPASAGVITLGGGLARP